MVDFETLLNALYEIQGASDPNHPAERMADVWSIACGMMEKSGYQPPDMR